MCESNVILEKDGKKETIMKEVMKMIINGNDITLIGILGERKEVQNARVKIADLAHHEILLERIS